METYNIGGGSALQQSAQLQANATQQAPHTASMRDALATAHGVADEALKIITAVTERLFGSTPHNPNVQSVGEIRSVPNGSADELLQSAHSLTALLHGLRGAANRLESRL